MDFQGIGNRIKNGVSAGLAGAYNNLFSAANLDDAAKRYTHALEGETYVPGVGVDSTFDVDSAEGRDIIAAERDKLLSAMQTYNKAHGERDEMRSGSTILEEDHGIDVSGLIIAAQKVQAVTNSDGTSHDGVSNEEFRM